MNAECPRCDRSFAADSDHLRVEYESFPRSSTPAEIEDLCPRCSNEFMAFIRGRPVGPGGPPEEDVRTDGGLESVDAGPCILHACHECGRRWRPSRHGDRCPHCAGAPRCTEGFGRCA